MYFFNLKTGVLNNNVSKHHPTKEEIIEYDKILKICKHCGKEFYKNPCKTVLSEFCCLKCAKQFASLTNKEEANKKISATLKGISTNKGGKIPVYENYLKHPKICPICSSPIPWERRMRKTCSEECARKLSVETARKNNSYKNTGGYREGSGRSKSGYWKGDFCGSTYELVYWIYCKEHNIPIERNTKRYPYIFEGKEHTYLPDYIVEGKLVEIKGYTTPLVYAKAAAVPEGIQILTNKDLEPMMEYIDKTYGTYHKGKVNNYHTLYDEYKPKFTYTCCRCGKEFTRDKRLVTELKFCSQSCAGKFSRPCNKDFVEESLVKATSVPVPGFEGYWFSEKNELFSNKMVRKDGKYLRCKLQDRQNGTTPNYKLNNSCRRSIKTLRMLCGYSEQE